MNNLDQEVKVITKQLSIKRFLARPEGTTVTNLTDSAHPEKEPEEVSLDNGILKFQ